MLTAILIPFAIGMIGMLQGALNKLIAGENGLNKTAFFSNVITFAICSVVFFVAKRFPQLVPSLLQHPESFSFKWWYVLPGIFGFFIIIGIPWSITAFGALKVTVGLVAAQMVTSLLWDFYVENLPLTGLKILGIVFGGISTLLITWSK